MALTQLSDVIIPQVYESYGFQPNPTLLSFLNSPAVRQSPFYDSVANREGRVTTVPYWNDLDASSDPNISTDSPSDIATPQKIAADSLLVRVADYNNAWSAADLVADLAGSNPMQMIKSRTNNYWSLQIQRFLSKITLGVQAHNIATDSGDMVHDLSQADGNAADDTHKFSHDAVLDTLGTMGDHFGELTAMIVPSTVMMKMRKQNSIQYIQPSQADFKIATYGGQCVVLEVNDNLLSKAAGTSGFKYTTVLCGPGVFAFGQGTPLNPVEIRREPLQGNGGGLEILVERKRWVFGVAGHSFTSSSVAGLSPTSAEWGTAGNWARKFQRQNVPMAFLVTNG